MVPKIRSFGKPSVNVKELFRWQKQFAEKSHSKNFFYTNRHPKSRFNFHCLSLDREPSFKFFKPPKFLLLFSKSFPESERYVPHGRSNSAGPRPDPSICDEKFGDLMFKWTINSYCDILRCSNRFALNVKIKSRRKSC